MGLTEYGPCETTEGRGKVIRILNANRWHPLAHVLVELEGGQRRWFVATQVWEVGKRPSA